MSSTGNDKPSAVLFDLDGTLIDTRSLYFEAYRVAVEPYIRADLTPEAIKALRPTSELGFIRAVVGEADVEACIVDFYDAYGRLHGTEFRGIFPGIPAVLARLREAGVPVGLVTGKSRRSWEITCANVALGEFDVLVFDDDVRAPKPDPHGLEIALEAVGAAPARAWYVGDTVSDARAARSAGLRAAAALWARAEEERPSYGERLRAEGAVLVERPEELPGILALNA